MSTQMSDILRGLDLRGLKSVASTNVTHNNNCKKLFHSIWDDGVKSTRLRYEPAVHNKFNPQKMFSVVNENLQFLDFNLPEGLTYGQVSVFGSGSRGLVEAAEWMDHIGRDGLYSKNLPSKYRVIYGGWRDHGRMIVVPVGSGITKLADIGLHFKMNSPKDKPKGEKYLGRILAHYEWAVPGTCVSAFDTPQGEVLTIKVDDDIVFDVLHVDLDSLDPVATQDDIRVELVGKINDANAAAGKLAIPLDTDKGWRANGKFVSFDKACEYYGVSLKVGDPMPAYNKAVADGAGFISLDLCKQLGKKFGIPSLNRIQEGQAIKTSVLDKLGLGKGFYQAVKGSRFGIISYGVKKQVTFDGFFLGSLGAVKGGEAFTCIQSMGAFMTKENSHLWSDLAAAYMDDLNGVIHDEKKFRSFMLKHIKLADDLLDELDMDGWLLMEALRNSVPILHNPGLFRRAVRYILTQVMNCTNKARIPYGKIAKRCNLMPDPHCFNFQTGAVDYRKSVIPVDSVCCMDVKEGPIVMYRQPLAHAKEACVAVNVHDRRFRKFAGRDVVIMGASALYQLKQMGGADFDDSVIIIDHPDWVMELASSDYPVERMDDLAAAPVEVVHPLDEDNRFLNKKRHTFPREWSMFDFFQSTVSATTQELSIGIVDNAIRLDAYLSGHHKQNMLEYLSAQIDKAEGPIYDDLITKYWWLHDRPEHPLRKVASNLERFIDAVKMGREIEGLTELLDQVDSILAESQVLPMCWMYLGKGGRGKIPVSRLVDQDYVLAPSLVCDVLSGIRLEVDKLLEALREEEWTMVQPPPETLGLAFPWDVATADVARELRAEWREQWANFFDGQYLDDKKKPIELSRMYQIIDSGGTVYLQDGSEVKLDGIKNMFGKWDEGIPKDEPQIRTQIAAHLARMIYRTRHNEAVRNDSGERRGFNDGLLWTKSIGLYYIQALKDAGLTGEYLPIKFDRYSQDLSDIDFEAKVYKGLVIRKSDGFEVGYVVGKLPKDGEYNVEGGLLVVQEAAPELLADATTINEEFDTPVEVE